MLPSEKQRDFATAIAETVGADLPEEETKEAYSKFIAENRNEFYRIRTLIFYEDQMECRRRT